MTKTEFNRARKYIKQQMPHVDFEFSETDIYKTGASGSDADFVEISVYSLFNIVNELVKKNEAQARDLKEIAGLCESCYYDCNVDGDDTSSLDRALDIIKEIAMKKF